MRGGLKKIKYVFWMLNGYIGAKFRLASQHKTMILITYYHPTRMKHINHQLRNLLKCEFVERIVISNHNPQIKLNSLVKVRDDRLFIVNQEERKGCGHRWSVAEPLSPKYLIAIDDDILLFPWQLKKLFSNLVGEPDIPHGFAGMVLHENGFLEYLEDTESQVDYICEIYAITGEQLKRYSDLKRKLTGTPRLTDLVETAADFVLISQTGKYRPKIHNGGHLFRCKSYNEIGIALHKNLRFIEDILVVARALDEERETVRMSVSNQI